MYYNLLLRFFYILLIFPTFLFSEGLILQKDTLFIEQTIEGGYHLWIKSEPGLGSVLLTESTADLENKYSSFSLQNPVYNKINGDEKRVLDGKFLKSQGTTQFALIDSTTENHPEYGNVFHIFIPYVVEYGYTWSRKGELQLLDGSWINIRTFEKPYADYTGAFYDNPYTIRVIQKPLTNSTVGNYMSEAVSAFEEISSEGKTVFGTGKEDIIENIREIIGEIKDNSLDLVICIDTTKSMEDNIPYLKKYLIPMLREETIELSSFRFGMVLYKDYSEEYITKIIHFQSDLDFSQSSINKIRAYGGKDIPEAVNEALYEGIHKFTWNADIKKIILIGDAPPHPIPRGRITAQMVYDDAKYIDININTIILPQ